MSAKDLSAAAADWLATELADTLDEDYELELSDPELSLEIRKIYRRDHPTALSRSDDFQALLTLQGELIKLQGWVAHSKEKTLRPLPAPETQKGTVPCGTVPSLGSARPSPA